MNLPPRDSPDNLVITSLICPVVGVHSNLSLQALMAKYECTDFKQLHEAWRKALDTEELNKKFYCELADWYFWALDHVEFPDDVEKDEATRNATNVIRLLTRLIFCWFLKEKDLIPAELFSERKLADVLKSLKDDDSTFYQAILQNLFFGTLNQRMNSSDRKTRKFANDGSFLEQKNEYGVKNLYRYQELFAISQQEAVELFSDIPFMNGGLFDCLDKEDDLGKVIYVDGFTRNPRKQPKLPNFLFFSDYRTVDLSDAYGNKKRKKEKVRGLINLLESYKFTVAENTPIEEEIALDPELLGKVFENLLASYNPETGTTARKQTGSFYTPREIVNYMVDESLIAYFKGKLTTDDANGPEDKTEERVRHLFAYIEEPHKFSDAEVDILIDAIDNAKILDPACGSGAFPMGILHKLVFILGKIDPHNQRWKQKQIAKAEQIPDVSACQIAVGAIEKDFETNDLDYGRKLYLIENGIYGVDIQPIAIQISKLRFFISLICDQRTNKNKAQNCGVRPLPNLETKFVAANTLIFLDRGEGLLVDPRLPKLEKELASVRHRHFAAQRRRDKLALQKKDAELREEIAGVLAGGNISGEVSRQLAAWNPYNQNTSAPFFDPEWMFGVHGGFSVTIGNPPYVRADEQSEWNKRQRKAILDSKQYETLWEKWDLYVPFIERSYKLLKPNGVTCLIVSDAYCHSKYAQKSQNWFLENSRILRLDFFGKIKIFNAAVHNMTYFFQRADGARNKPERHVHDPEFGQIKALDTDEQKKLTCRVFFPEDAGTETIACPTVTINTVCYLRYGLAASSDEKEHKGEFVTEDVTADLRDKTHVKPWVEGKLLAKWQPLGNRWLEWGTERAPAHYRRKTFGELYEVAEKLLILRVAGANLRVAYDNQQLYTNHTSIICVPWHALAGVYNRSIKKSARYEGEKPARPDLPRRENLEQTSKRFALKFVLAVMNSTVARELLRGNRRSNTDLYPDDWKKLPIPDVTKEEQEPIVALVDQILDLKKMNPLTDVSALEQKVDSMVARLYSLGPARAATAEERDR